MECREPRTLLAFIFLILLLTSGIASLSADERVRLQLRWDHQFQFAGYYAALWRGYYEEAGLEVEIRSAIQADGSILSAIDEVAAGRAEFGIGSTDILYALDRGTPLSIVASIFQKSGVAFFAPKSAGMHTPSDLTGLRVSRRTGDLVDVELQAMLLAEGIDPARVEPHPFDQTRGYLAEMVAGRIDVIPGYIIGTPHEAAELGIEIDTLRPIDYGVDFYGDSLFTVQDLTAKDPDLVTAFRDASLRGWEYALEHPEEIAAEILAAYRPAFPIHDFASFVRFQTEPVAELILHPIIALGHINPARWERANSTMIRLGLIESPFNKEQAIFDPERREEERRARVRILAVTALLLILLLFIAAMVWLKLLQGALKRRTLELRRRETLYHDLVDRLPAIIYTFKTGYGGLFYSPYVKILGYTPQELLNAPLLWYESIHPEDKPIVNQVIEAAIEGAPQEVEYRIRHRDGHWIWFLDRTYPLREGGIQLFEGIALDITLLKESQAELKAMVEEKERLMREVNHRVKNNLLMVNSLIQLKSSELGPEVDLKDLLHRIDAIRIIHEKLYQSGSMTTIRIREYLEELLRTIFELSGSIIAYESRLEALTMPTGIAVPLGLIVNELATNTIKHGVVPGGTRFTLELRREAHKGRARLTAGNNGPPLPEETDSAQGLGLSLIRALTKQIDGTLHIESAPHPRFQIEFPLTEKQTSE